MTTIRCPKCQSNVKWQWNKPMKKINGTRRCYECVNPKCKHRFVTWEAVPEELESRWKFPIQF